MLLSVSKATGNSIYLDAAIEIAETLKKTQKPDGCWPFRVVAETGEIIEDYTSDQINAIVLFDQLASDYNRKALLPLRDRVFNWMMENPVKTKLWQNQYEDVLALEPYENLEFNDLARFVTYLTEKGDGDPDEIRIARDLYRFVEDQFVVWENSMDRTWITPGVKKEQYICYHPVSAHCGAFILMSINLHRLTNEETYLEKACAIADTLTAIQHPEGLYPTHMLQSPSREGELGLINYEKIWPNCKAKAAMALFVLDEYLESTSVSSKYRTDPG